MRRASAVVLLAAVSALGCAGGRKKEDPLKNTKKLVVEGHLSLYKNGAFAVPSTSISLIPPGPKALDLAGQLMGKRARKAFTSSVKRAAESVYVVSKGTRLSLKAGGEVSETAAAIAGELRKTAREGSTFLIDRSWAAGKGIAGEAWETSRRILGSGAKADAAAKDAGALLGDAAGRAAAEAAAMGAAAPAAAGHVSKAGLRAAGRDAAKARAAFIRGYAAVPARLKERKASAGASLADARFFEKFSQENTRRSRWSGKTVDLLADTVKGYPENVAGAMRKAGDELADYRTTGVGFAALKALRWVLQGLLADAAIVPAASIAGASLGYVGVNLVAFPVMVVAREGGVSAKVAVEVAWDGARAAYDLTAPSGEAALAGLLALSEAAVSQAAAAGVLAGVAAAGYGTAGIAKAGEIVVKGGAAAAGKSVRYLGVPLASAGIAVGGGTIGTLVGGVGAASGAAVRVAGETSAGAGLVFGNVIAGTVVGAGAAASGGAAAASAVYEVSKAVVVPPGYVLGGAIVLDYATMTHLAAQSVLAAADCAYLVLSLEGPRWVLYAVRGDTSDPPAGAVVDLAKIREGGEEVLNVPLTDEQMKELVRSTHENLPAEAGAEHP